MVYIYAFLIILDYLAFCDFVRCGENEKTKLKLMILFWGSTQDSMMFFAIRCRISSRNVK